MTRKLAAAFLFACLLGAEPVRAATKDEFQFVEVTESNMDVKALSDVGKQTLASPDWKWKSSQSDHFVVHYEKDIFAAKVARMGEFFYSYIAADLKGAIDKAPGRSHIFIFRNEKEWKSFMAKQQAGASEWAYSFVSGWSMYLQQANDIQASAEVLGHEMTHMVVNRFLTGRLPIWLNEGMAEWYGEFAYSEYKGVKKSKRAQFRGLKIPYTLTDLVAADGYPASAHAVSSFYQTAKYLVAFFMLEKPQEKFLPFVTDIAGGAPFEKAMQANYEIDGMPALEEQFKKFCK